MRKQLYIIDPRRFHLDRFRKLLCRKKCFEQVFCVDNVKEAIVLAADFKVKTKNKGLQCFFLAGIAYLYLFRALEQIYSEVSYPRICVFDEKPYPGCGILAERLCIHGFSSCFDEEAEILRCTTCLTQNTVCVAESMKEYLNACLETQRLRCRAEYHDLLMHRLDEREMNYFLEIVAGKAPGDVAKEQGLEAGSMHNYLLDIRKKLGINTTSQFKDIANECGWGRGSTTDSQMMRVVK